MRVSSLSSFFRGPSQRWQRNLLMAHADALVTGSAARDRVRAACARSGETELEALLELTERIERAMPPVAPSERFVAELHQRLLQAEVAQSSRSLWARVQRLPWRTRIAAGIGGATLTAGVVILATRSVYDALGNRRNRRAITA
ncbi:MAG: hypothetical protein ACUVSU_14025 [Aggregatilineaceae bacterium]